ncbi:hypothetical protein [Brevundimonas sp. A19_0]|uniref:hypothetical protein n=1 Tax=Brevundimonas sp. A19_0 TaxID=2821087 RepID=UPI001AD9CC97|nr:hypothetical protein [Brevundimonas sp. A19_0]MBO9500679.1 hypothetical protein [Brevundimonas sp. A19_0]
MRRLILFVALAALLLAGLNLASRQFEDRRYLDPMNDLLAATSGRDAIIVGSSVGGAIRFDALCTDGADFFFVLQDLFETRAMVDLVLDRPDPPRHWFLALSPGAVFYDNSISASGRTHNRRLTYRFLFENGQNDMIGGDWRQYAVTRISPALGYDDWRRRFQNVLVRVGLRPEAKPVGSLIWRLDGTLGADDELALADREAAARLEDIRSIRFYDPSVPERAGRAIADINARIRASGGQLYIVVPPASPEFQRRTREGLAEELDGLWRSLDEVEDQGAVVVNAWRDPARVYPSRLFVDPNHMNPEGARIFSADLAAVLRARGDDAPGCPA